MLTQRHGGQPHSCHFHLQAETPLVPKTSAQAVPKGGHGVTIFAAVHPPPAPPLTPALAQAEHVLALSLNGCRVSSILHSKTHTPAPPSPSEPEALPGR